MKPKVLIVGWHRLTDISPRAFRVSSLRRSLGDLGTDVQIITVADEAWPTSGSRIVVVTGKLLGALRTLLKLRGTSVDLVISVSSPFLVHIIVALALRLRFLRAKRSIADYGDPYSCNPNGRRSRWREKLERWIIASFDRVVVPDAKAISAYATLVDQAKIRVIPQGVDLSRNYAGRYKRKALPRFGYAGIFYGEIRNPKNFLSFLSELDVDFEFHVYTDICNRESMSVIEPYRGALDRKLRIFDKIDRVTCIRKLSELDFLVNFVNDSSVQTPSKLIDYTLSGRPFLNIQPKQVEFSQFLRYLRYDFDGFVPLDLSEHEELRVAERFLSILNGGTSKEGFDSEVGHLRSRRSDKVA